jgi:hypothetical protein
MMADGLTKALNKALIQRFRDMIWLEDQVERLTLIRREDELKDQQIEMRLGETKHMTTFTYL